MTRFRLWLWIKFGWPSIPAIPARQTFTPNDPPNKGVDARTRQHFAGGYDD